MKNLDRPYGAYYSNRSTVIDEDLTRVAKGTPCGEYMRRFWQPVALTRELTDVARVTRVLGEDLVVFKDGSGCIGVLEKRCCHRGASLEFGKIAEQGIQCCYHGWHFDVDGTILATPAEPSTSRIKERLRQGAYPTREYQGLVFAYLGSPERKPAFPTYDCYERNDISLETYTLHSPCNWLQIRENDLDTSHAKFLHTDLFGVQVAEVYTAQPVYDWRDTSIGILSVSARRWKENVFLRATDLIFPALGRFTAIEDGEGQTRFDRRAGTMSWCVPVDDTNSITFNILEIEENLPDPKRNAFIDRQAVDQSSYQIFDEGQDGSRSYEERQRAPGDWDAWVSQGPVSYRERDHLVSSDAGVVMLRKALRAGIRDVAQGRDPKGVFPQLDGPLNTYAHSTVTALEKGLTEAEDSACLDAFSKHTIDEVLARKSHRSDPEFETRQNK